MMMGKQWRLSAAASALALVLGLLGFLAAPPARAAVGDRPVATWNMFGANTADSDKWRVAVPWLASRVDVLALQEAGARPPDPAEGTVAETIGQNNGLLIGGNHDDRPVVLPPGIGREVTHSIWEFGAGERRHVYWLATDRAAQGNGWQESVNHVNLAIVTSVAADQVAIIPNTLAEAGGNHPYSARAALGVRIGDTWYFDLHAMSGSGNDGAGLLQNMQDFVDDQPLAIGARNWIALGDFNRDPDVRPLTIPTGTTMYRSHNYTHGLVRGSSLSELDYAVGTTTGGVQVNRVTNSMLLGLSDHVPVHVGAMRAAAEPRVLLPHHTAVENMQAGGVLDAEHEGTANFTQIVGYARNGQENQSWMLEFYDDATLRFRGMGSGRCVDITHSDQNPGAGRGLSLYDCSHAASQRWSAEPLGNNQWMFHSVLRPSLCMNLKGGQTDPRDPKDLILWDCQNTPNERFALTPAEGSTGETGQPGALDSGYGQGPYSLENTGNGGYMDVFHEQTANDSTVISWSRTGRRNQGWWLEWRDDYTTAFHGAGSHRCLDIHRSNDNVGPDRRLVLWDCTGQPSQGWIGVQLRNGQVQWRNQLYNHLCLDVADPGHNPGTVNDTGTLVTENCRLDWETQQWSFEPFDLSGSPSIDEDQDWDGENLRVGVVIPNPGPPAQRVGYFNSWSVYANDFHLKDLDTRGIAGRLTHLNYAFENIHPTNLTCFAANQAGSSDENDPNGNDGASDAWADYQKGYASDKSVDGSTDAWDQPLKGNFNQIKQLKVKYPNLKVLVSLGGWTYSKYFSDVAATAASRSTFVSSCIDMYIRGNLPVLDGSPAGGQGVASGVFDGFDIDWEFPGSANGHTGNHSSPADTANFTALLREFRTQLDALGGRRYELTAALPAGLGDIGKLEVGNVAAALDFGSVMSYDMHGAWEANGPTNFQAPLHDSVLSPAFASGLTVNHAINAYLMNGFPSDKLIMGVPFYGRGWTGVPGGAAHGLYQPVTGPSPAFAFSQQPGVAMYKELAAAGKLTDVRFDMLTQSSWVYDGTSFWSIESPRSLLYKRQYIQDKRLAGVMIYSLEADDSASTLLNAALS